MAMNNSLAEVHPELVSEWSEKNLTLTPDDIAGLTTLRSEIKDLTRDEAIVYMVESNFQRTTILPSEKAFAYKMRFEAMKRQGKRTDLTSSPVGKKLRTDEIIAQESGDSRNQIHRCETL